MIRVDWVFDGVIHAYRRRPTWHTDITELAGRITEISESLAYEWIQEWPIAENQFTRCQPNKLARYRPIHSDHITTRCWAPTLNETIFTSGSSIIRPEIKSRSPWQEFLLKTQDILPVLISIIVIILVALVEKQSKLAAAITATMPIGATLALWIVYSANDGEQKTMEQFRQAC